MPAGTHAGKWVVPTAMSRVATTSTSSANPSVRRNPRRRRTQVRATERPARTGSEGVLPVAIAATLSAANDPGDRIERLGGSVSPARRKPVRPSGGRPVGRRRGQSRSPRTPVHRRRLADGPPGRRDRLRVHLRPRLVHDPRERPPRDRADAAGHDGRGTGRHRVLVHAARLDARRRRAPDGGRHLGGCAADPPPPGRADGAHARAAGRRAPQGRAAGRAVRVRAGHLRTLRLRSRRPAGVRHRAPRRDRAARSRPGRSARAHRVGRRGRARGRRGVRHGAPGATGDVRARPRLVARLCRRPALAALGCRASCAPCSSPTASAPAGTRSSRRRRSGRGVRPRV